MTWMAVPNSNRPSPDTTAKKQTVDIVQVQSLVQGHCIQCHAAKPSLMPTAAKGITFDTPAQISKHAPLIYQQVVLQKNMPLGNTTKMTDEERALIAAWYESGIK